MSSVVRLSTAASKLLRRRRFRTPLASLSSYHPKPKENNVAGVQPIRFSSVSGLSSENGGRKLTKSITIKSNGVDIISSIDHYSKIFHRRDNDDLSEPPGGGFLQKDSFTIAATNSNRIESMNNSYLVESLPSVSLKSRLCMIPSDQNSLKVQKQSLEICNDRTKNQSQLLVSALAGRTRSSMVSPNSNTFNWNQSYYKWNGMNNRQVAYFSTEPKTSMSSQTGEETQPEKPIFTGVRTTNRPNPKRSIGKTRVPTPHSGPAVETTPLDQLKKTTPRGIARKAYDMTISLVKTVVSFLSKLPGNVLFYVTHPKELQQAWHNLRDYAKEEAHHYWVGTKLLWADVQTARNLLNKTLSGSSLTRRERKQLLRTVSDLFRLIPFSMFVLIPFMEFALPFALRLFPNMLPSTYQDSLKAEENMKRELKSRIAMAQFFQETLGELAKEQKRKATSRKKELEDAGVDLTKEGDLTINAQEDTAKSMLEFLEKAQKGEMIPPDLIIRYANYFQDDLTLDNMPRMQLVNMCKYMGIPPYGSDSFLRFQLRHKIRVLKEDDQRILWEGLDSLTKMELREACQERGMRSIGLSKDAYRRALQQWLDLSVNKDVPISLLIMSRTFFLREEMVEKQQVDDSKSLTGLADAISGLDKGVLNEVILEVATNEEKRSDPEVRKIKLEVLSQQNERIREEQEARDAAAKKKEAAEREKEKEKSESPHPDSGIQGAHAEKSTTETSQTIVEAKGEDEIKAESEKQTEHVESKKGQEEQRPEELSPEDLDAISQLVSENPVIMEREELERIKAAIKGDEAVEISMKPVEESTMDSTKDSTGKDESKTAVDTITSSSTEPASIHDEDKAAQLTIEQMDAAAKSEADKVTKIELDAHLDSSKDKVEEEEEEEDPVVARLKKRLESMVDKIEVQLSETELKIGDKLHMLDKDGDGLLSRDEVAEALQQVLKRKISFDEAIEIANEMDENNDGVFTVEELIRWIDKHKLVRFVEEGRDADMDRLLQKQSKTSSQKAETESENSTVERKDASN